MLHSNRRGLLPRLIAGAMVLAGAGSADTATAAQVTIRMKGGGVEVTGELRSFDGQKYVIEAPKLGLMTFDAQRIECVGEACTRRVTAPSMPYEPLSASAPETVAVAGSGIAAEVLIPTLVRGYASAIGATVAPILGTAQGEQRIRLTDTKGAELATFVIAASAQPLDMLKAGKAHIALSERALSEAESKALVAEMPEPRPSAQATALAGDGIAVIVSPDNPALSLGEDAIARIFAGKAPSWIDAGVSGGKIAIYADKGGTGLAALANAILRPRGLAASAAITELPSEAEVADAVTRDPNGIGVVSFASSRNARRLNFEGPCGIITRPASFAVKAGEWALSRRLYAVTLAGAAQPTAARDLMRYAQSKEAQAALAEAQLIDTSVESQGAEDQTGRMAAAMNAPPQAFDAGEMRELLADVKNAKRLSLTFRFVPGTIDLDAGARRDVARLTELMLAPDSTGQTFLLIGFTEAEGKLSQTVATSLKRAGQVRNAVLAAAGKLANPQALIAKGHGAIAPVACNDTGEHRSLNRRVEVWVRSP
jgi:phosphate transport system substrate-binding protein